MTRDRIDFPVHPKKTGEFFLPELPADQVPENMLTQQPPPHPAQLDTHSATTTLKKLSNNNKTTTTRASSTATKPVTAATTQQAAATAAAATAHQRSTFISNNSGSSSSRRSSIISNTMKSVASSSTTAISFRAMSTIILGATLLCSPVTAFTSSPTHRLGSTVRATRKAHRNPIVRSSSYSTLGDGITSPARTSPSSPVPGWVRAKVSQANGVRRGSPPPQRQGDWSTLFAAPVPEVAQGRLHMPLSGLSRSCAGLAEGSCGSSLIFFGMVSLVYAFAPVFAAQSLFAWGFGRVGYWWSMRGADVSQRLPAGFVGYMSLFLMVGGLAFMNGLKGIALMA